MSVTAWPVILVDSTNGAASDTACSGAGPSTALSGTANASSDGAGTTVTLPAGTDLSNVSTLGDHVLLFRDTTAGHRQFSAINGKAGSGGATPTVTVEQAFSATITNKDWAIGGVRATVGGAVSLLLFNNNSAAGDAMPGWAEEMQSGHDETTGRIDLKRSGDTTGGPITLRGKSGAAVKPILRCSTAVNVIVPGGAYQACRDFKISAENAAVTAAIANSAGTDFTASGITLVRTATNKFTTGITAAATWAILNCEIAFCTTGISVGPGPALVEGNYLHDISGDGIAGISDTLSISILKNVLDVTGGANGITVGAWGTTTRGILIQDNTVDGGATATGAGVKVTAAPADGLVLVLGNLLSNMGTYGIDFSNAGSTDRAIGNGRIHVRNNNTYNNTSGAYHSATGGYSYNNCPWASGDSNLNPTYTGGGNYTPGNTSLKGTTFPLAVGPATNYGYPGAIQPNAAGTTTVIGVPFPGGQMLGL